MSETPPKWDKIGVTTAFWSFLVRESGAFLGLPKRCSLHWLGKLGLLLMRDESTLERVFSHLKILVGSRGTHTSPAQVERRLVIRLMEESWLKADLSFAFQIVARAEWRYNRLASQKKRKDAGVKRKAALVPVALDEATFDLLLEGEVTDTEKDTEDETKAEAKP